MNNLEEVISNSKDAVGHVADSINGEHKKHGGLGE